MTRPYSVTLELEFIYRSIEERQKEIDELLARAKSLEEYDEKEAQRDAAFDRAKREREERG